MKKYIEYHGLSFFVGISTPVGIYFFLSYYSNQSFALWISMLVLLGCWFIFFFPYMRERKDMKKMEELSSPDYLFSEPWKGKEAYFAKFYSEKGERMRLAYQEELVKQNTAIKEMEEYMALWVHEVKTPLAALGLMAENKPGDFSSKMKKELSRVEACIDQAMYYARSQSPREDYLIRKISLEDIVNRVLRENSTRLIEQGIHIEKENLKIQGYTDSKWLIFILNQLMNNAIQYRKENSEFCFFGEERDEWIELGLKDNGIGIKASDLPRIFERGYTGETGRKFGKSTGMGLYICKKLCEKLYMDIKVVSQQGEGTRVTLYIPKEKKIFTMPQ